MPPKRPTSTARNASQRAQSTLSFNKPGAQNRITKPSAKPSSKSSPKHANTKTKVDPAIIDLTPASADPDLTEPTTAEKAITQQTQEVVAAADPLTDATTRTEDVLGGRAQESALGATDGRFGAGWVGDEEILARKVPDSRIKAYWRAKEGERKAPRVHQEGLTVAEKVLREWDMSGQFGPCIGISRLKRWKRARVLGLNPPIEVLAVLLKGMHEGDAVKMQRAHVDELMSSRFIET